MTNKEEESQAAESRLIDHYQSQQISNDRLHAILTDTQATKRNRFLGFAVAASLLVMSIAVLTHQNILTSQRTDTVLREAALNHASKLKMDAEAQSLSELQVALAELPFTIKLPESPLFEKLAVVGGRYCTISGNLAAHLKLADPKTLQQYSLFLTPTADNLQSMKSPEVEISGVGVKLWHEDDVVYAFAQTKGSAL